MTKLDRVTRMPARTLLWGFLGFVAVASAVTMFSDPLDPTIGDGSVDPANWSPAKLQSYLTENGVPFGREDRRSVLVRLVKRHRQLRESEALAASRSTRSERQAGDPMPAAQGERDERTPLLSTQQPLKSQQAENERLERASNLR